MGPFSWILWTHAWLGIATDAFDRARRFTRDTARRAPENATSLAQRLAQLMARLAPLRGSVRGAVHEFAEMEAGPGREGLYTMSSALWLNALKVSASEGAVGVCQGALDVIGIAGFRNDTPYSVGRHIRDALSAPLMVANQRLNALNGTMLTVVKEL
jgi:acyl-CoA dehydrogenase